MRKSMKKQNPCPSGTASRRRSGAFMIVAMICLLLTTALMGTLLKMAVLGLRQAHVDASGLQADWLAESALDRAAAKLAKDATYAGETWNIPEEDLDGLHTGRVVISINPPVQNLAEVEVAAQYPAEGAFSVKRTKRLLVALTPQVAATSLDLSPALAEKQGSGGEREEGR
jgi:type II secretory pathway component PulK